MNEPAKTMGMVVATELDTVGQRCPIPVLKARKRMKSLESGEVLCLLADDPLSTVDVAHFCEEDGHTLLQRLDEGERWRFFIRKRADETS